MSPTHYLERDFKSELKFNRKTTINAIHRWSLLFSRPSPWSPEPEIPEGWPHQWRLKQNECSVFSETSAPFSSRLMFSIGQISIFFWLLVIWRSPCPLAKATEYSYFSFQQLLCKFLGFHSFISLAKQHERKYMCWLTKTVLLFRLGLCAKRKRKDQSARETTLNIQPINSE